MPHVIYYYEYQQTPSNTAVDDVASKKSSNSLTPSSEITVAGPTTMVTASTRSGRNTYTSTAGSHQKIQNEGASDSFSPHTEEPPMSLAFQQTFKDLSYVRERSSHDPSTFTHSSSSDNDTNTSCQQTNISASMDSKNISQPSLHANHRNSTTRKLSPAQNQGSLTGAKKRCHHYRIFESNVEKLKEYIEKHGHMNVTSKENRLLNAWMKDVRRSFKQIQQGQPPHILLGRKRMKMLEGINFEFHKQCNQSFESNVEKLKEYIEKHGHMNVTSKENKSLRLWIKVIRCSFEKIQQGQPPRMQLGQKRMEMLEGINFDFRKQRNQQSFESSVEKLKEYIEKHGHMNVTSKENLHLYNWIRYVRTSFEKIQQGQPPIIHLGQERMEMLEEINFDFRKPHDRSFESSVEKLKEYIEKHGHMNVTRKENKSLHEWIRHVKRSFKRTQEGRSHTMRLGKERMEMLDRINFDFGPKQNRAVKYGQKRSCSLHLTETKDDTFRAPKIQRRESTVQKMPPSDGTTCHSRSQLLGEGLPCKQSCQSFESSAEGRKMSFHEKNDLDEQCEEHNRIEIEGDLIPRWLVVGDDEGQ